ncbi:glycosyl hydrolases family 18-domain-containing protein [Cercophora scortea]|uniref:chitinase n=1 Tax=Cercophora scortea TaxID=314031 RepID=A0AAE0MML2_9PEZI|nr:glycosyl hydrolases family 18-domain-containing protein [Cercophora scortea]
MVQSLSFTSLLLSILAATITTSVNAAPHESLGRNAGSATASTNQDAVTCPNNLASIPAMESWYDYSVKIRPEANAAGEQCQAMPALFKREDYTCDEHRPCSNNACCGKTGNCGYGSKYCGDGKTSPNDVCWSHCDAKAECGKDAAKPGQTCPLNTCCSEFGFCGVTSDFCGKGCQSNCVMPEGSGKSGGSVQKRIVGYYEAWKDGDDCAAMNTGMKTIPLGAFSHLVAAFGGIDGKTFGINAMPGMQMDEFSKIAKIKTRGAYQTKFMVSLGGWTFNDNGTDTQPIFTNLVSSSANRAKFVDGLMSFLMSFGFDGVDIDWEYPGAGDRGGHPTDGKNYLALLQDIRKAFDASGKGYVLSFTTPTSLFYLRNFASPDDTGKSSNLKKMTDVADFVNVMSYDLHGTWDGPEDKIGKIVLAHTNMTEIQAALDLFWRVGVDPAKLNLGVGFYGRSYQLSNPSCRTPGCAFKGGADKGHCTGQSGILSYKEIMQIIEKNNIQPTWDETAAVKYISWNGDQWVSFDDQQTFQQKIKYADSEGLGGLAIWAIDLDTDDLQALQGLLYPKTLNDVLKDDDSSRWQESLQGTCRLTDCSDKPSCKPGEIKISEQRCDHGKNQLCCPVTNAPDPKHCTWRGNPKYCNGRCHENEVAMEQNKWGGNNDKCKDGNKVYCCELPPGEGTQCRITDCGGKCHDNENSIAGDFYDNCFLDPKKVCCPKDSPFKASTCHWQGKPGSCYDNVCAFNTEIQLAQSWDGGGDDCGGWHLERDRVFCCTAPGGKQPFLPVPLEYLFKDPPKGNNVDADFKLNVDDTWGSGTVKGDDDTPNDAAFGFFVMASPQELQTSLDKRDGSHWELFDCVDDGSEEAQTIRMFCNDDSSESNCGDIGLGHGVPGTILEMPKGCGPGRYAVAVDMKPSVDQSIPGHLKLVKRVAEPVVYDLTFDYDFRRVPRDANGQSQTQWRLDYSNEEGYWDKVVNSPGQTRRKRSFTEPGQTRNHKRYLENAWSEDIKDHRAGLISRAELHERWFGKTALDWLKGLFTVTKDIPAVQHSISENINVLLLDERYQCNIKGVDVGAKLQVEAQLNAQVDTSFGLTISATLGTPIDLSGSYLYFRSSGSITALFTIDALVAASYDTGDIELFGLQNFGATFSIPGILTVGPNFKIFGSVNMDVSLSGKFQAQHVLAKWDSQLTFPDPGRDEDPKDLHDPVQDGTQEVGKTTVDWSVDARGQITAHVKPTVSFGIEFNSKFIPFDKTTVDLVADGWVQAYVSATANGAGKNKFCYGANAGAKLYCQLNADKSMQWLVPAGNPFTIWQPATKAIIKETCPISTRDIDMDIDSGLGLAAIDTPDSSFPGHLPAMFSPLSRRDSRTVGPLIHLPKLSCPGAGTGSSDNISTCPFCTDDEPAQTRRRELVFPDFGVMRLDERATGGSCALPGPTDGEASCILDSSSPAKRDLYGDGYNFDDIETGNFTDPLWPEGELQKRLSEKTVQVPGTNPPLYISLGMYPSCGEALSKSTIPKYFTFIGDGNKVQTCTPNVGRVSKTQIFKGDVKFVTEHVYEAQTLAQFFAWLRAGNLGPNYQGITAAWVDEVLLGYGANPYHLPADATLGIPTGSTASVDDVMAFGFARSDRPLGGTGGLATKAMTERNFAIASAWINSPKEAWFAGGTPQPVKTNQDSNGDIRRNIRNAAGVFNYLHYTPSGTGSSSDEAIWNKFMRVSNWIDLVCYRFDQTYPWGHSNRAGEPTTIATFGHGPSLRDLYAYWIRAYLQAIETKADAWAGSAKATYDQVTGNTKAEKAWEESAFGNNGWAAVGSLRLPGGGYVAGYGAYGNAQMTFDARGNRVNIPNAPNNIQ